MNELFPCQPSASSSRFKTKRKFHQQRSVHSAHSFLPLLVLAKAIRCAQPICVFTQAQGVHPNQASAVALTSSCKECPHLADQVADLTAQVTPSLQQLSLAQSPGMHIPNPIALARTGSSSQQHGSAAYLQRKSGSSTNSTPRQAALHARVL